MDINKLKSLLIEPCNKMYGELRAKYGKNLIGFGFYSSEDFTTISIIGATTEGKKNMMNQQGLATFQMI